MSVADPQPGEAFADAEGNLWVPRFGQHSVWLIVNRDGVPRRRSQEDAEAADLIEMTVKK